MGRPKLQEKDKKTKLGITIDRELNQKIEDETSNKSALIEKILTEYFNRKHNHEN
jgi:hypothetical protein